MPASGSSSSTASTSTTPSTIKPPAKLDVKSLFQDKSADAPSSSTTPASPSTRPAPFQLVRPVSTHTHRRRSPSRSAWCSGSCAAAMALLRESHVCHSVPAAPSPRSFLTLSLFRGRCFAMAISVSFSPLNTYLCTLSFACLHQATRFFRCDWNVLMVMTCFWVLRPAPCPSSPYSIVLTLYWHSITLGCRHKWTLITLTGRGCSNICSHNTIRRPERLGVRYPRYPCLRGCHSSRCTHPVPPHLSPRCLPTPTRHIQCCLLICIPRASAVFPRRPPRPPRHLLLLAAASHASIRTRPPSRQSAA